VSLSNSLRAGDVTRGTEDLGRHPMFGRWYQRAQSIPASWGRHLGNRGSRQASDTCAVVSARLGAYSASWRTPAGDELDTRTGLIYSKSNSQRNEVMPQ
jgi:hypothetical protein